MQTLVKNVCMDDDIWPKLGLEIQNIAKQNRTIVKAKWLGKKYRLMHGIVFLGEPLPPLIEHLHFYGRSVVVVEVENA